MAELQNSTNGIASSALTDIKLFIDHLYTEHGLDLTYLKGILLELLLSNNDRNTLETNINEIINAIQALSELTNGNENAFTIETDPTYTKAQVYSVLNGLALEIYNLLRSLDINTPIDIETAKTIINVLNNMLIQRDGSLEETSNDNAILGKYMLDIATVVSQMLLIGSLPGETSLIDIDTQTLQLQSSRFDDSNPYCGNRSNVRLSDGLTQSKLLKYSTDLLDCHNLKSKYDFYRPGSEESGGFQANFLNLRVEQILEERTDLLGNGSNSSTATSRRMMFDRFVFLYFWFAFALGNLKFCK